MARPREPGGGAAIDAHPGRCVSDLTITDISVSVARDGQLRAAGKRTILPRHVTISQLRDLEAPATSTLSVK